MLDPLIRHMNVIRSMNCIVKLNTFITKYYIPSNNLRRTSSKLLVKLIKTEFWLDTDKQIYFGARLLLKHKQFGMFLTSTITGL